MLGQGLYEANVWDPKSGRKLTSNFRTYKVPTANETPRIETYFLGIPDPQGPYGAKEGSLGFAAGCMAPSPMPFMMRWVSRAYEVPIRPEKLLQLLKRRKQKRRRKRNSHAESELSC